MSSNVVCIVAALESDHGAVARHGGVGTDSVNFVRTLVDKLFLVRLLHCIDITLWMLISLFLKRDAFTFTTS